MGIPMDFGRLAPARTPRRTRISTRRTSLRSRATTSNTLDNFDGRSRATTSNFDGDAVLRVVCVTWNVGATTPRWQPEESLVDLLSDEPDADIVCVGLQEVCKLTTKNLL